MAFVERVVLILFLLAHLQSLAASSAHARGNLTHPSTPAQCLPDHANALLKLKQSFVFKWYSTTTLPSWQAGTDCCQWEGVGCGNPPGHVTLLNLSGFELDIPSGIIDPVLFNLTSLRLLDLSMNNFGRRAYFPSVGIERLTLLTHLNLSLTMFNGEIPSGIGRLNNLISLDLSSIDDYLFDNGLGVNVYGNFTGYHFSDLVANLTNLRELILDGVYISSRTEDCFNVLAKSTPHLRVLSLGYCGLKGHIDPSLSRLHNLEMINLSGNDGMTPSSFPEFLMNFVNLSVLRLAASNLEGWFPQGIFKSKSLRLLDLSRNPNLLGHLPSFSNASSLKILRLEMTNFYYAKSKSTVDFNSIMELGVDRNFISMDFPSFSIFVSLRKLVLTRFSLLIRNSESVFSWIEDMRNLTSLVLHECNFLTATNSSLGNSESRVTIQTLSAITNLKKLRSLSIIGCNFSESLPSTIGNMSNMETLDITNSKIAGTIPNSIGNLTRLTRLTLCGNQLTGNIPASLFTLPALEGMDLSSNKLTGPIPEFKVISSQLIWIVLDNNRLMGPIPKSFFLLTSLCTLSIAKNTMTGTVDLASLWRLKNLAYLFLSDNKLSVTDGGGSNSSATYLSTLEVLGLANCNITKIPNFLTRVSHMLNLDLSSNIISGNIPKWIWERWGNNLEVLNLSHNMFTGMELPIYLSSAYYLSLSKNNISAYLTHSFCDSYIKILDLSYNNFKGAVPPCLMENEFTTRLNLRENQFEGELPSNISSGCSLRTIDLHGNKIEGQLPRALCNCTRLEVLDLGRNQIADTFPTWLGTLLNLRVLVLISNQFHGSIGYLKDEKSDENFSCLQIIDLASNKFSGNLHPRWFENLKSMDRYNNTWQIVGYEFLTKSGFYQDTVTISYKGVFVTFGRILSTLTAIDLSDNALKGRIPASIGRLVSLRVLNMSHNTFSGEIPCQFGGVTALESLDLSSNMLSGEIPQELTNLTFLSILNLSDNHLEGRIPQSHQFTTFQSGSFDGNVELCGQPLSKQCGIPVYEPNLESSSDSVDIVLFLFVGMGFGMGFAASILVKVGWIKRWFSVILSRGT